MNLLVNFVYDDEELLEPYEWQDDDTFEEVDRIEKLLHDPKVQRDLQTKDEE